MLNNSSGLFTELSKALNSSDFTSMFKDTFSSKNTLESLYAAVSNNSIVKETLSKSEEESVTKLLNMFTQEQVTMLGIKVHKLTITIE